MGGDHTNPLSRLALYPATENAAAWEDQSVCAAALEGRKFEVLIKRRGRGWTPGEFIRNICHVASSCDPRKPPLIVRNVRPVQACPTWTLATFDNG